MEQRYLFSPANSLSLYDKWTDASSVTNIDAVCVLVQNVHSVGKLIWSSLTSTVHAIFYENNISVLHSLVTELLIFLFYEHVVDFRTSVGLYFTFNLNVLLHCKRTNIVSVRTLVPENVSLCVGYKTRFRIVKNVDCRNESMSGSFTLQDGSVWQV